VRLATASQLKSFQAVRQPVIFGAVQNSVQISGSNSQFGQAAKVAVHVVGGFTQPFEAFSLKLLNAGTKVLPK
jgi:hypothetical protein